MYNKIILTIIAIALIGLFFQNFNVIPKADAAINSGYALVPVNPDGSINVRLSSQVDVNIAEVGGYSVYSKVPVEIK